MRFLSVGPRICLQLPSDSTSRWTPLVLAVSFPLLGRIRAFHPLVTCAARRTKKDLAPSSCEKRDKTLDNPAVISLDAIPSPFVVASDHPATLYRLPEHLLLIFLSISNLPIFFHVNIVLRYLLGDIPYRRANTFEKYNSSL